MASEITFLFGQFVPRCTHRIDKHFEDYYVIQMCNGGAVDLAIGSERYKLEGRWYWSSYPGPKIKFNPAAGTKMWVHRYLAFRGPGVQEWIKAGLFPIRPQPADAAGQKDAERFDELLELSRRADRWGNARASLLLESMLTELAEARVRPHAVPGWIGDVLARSQELGTQVTQDELATIAGMTPRTFRRQFRAVMGMSPLEYVIECRVSHAKEMLGRTELPIKQIAQQLGYQDVFFFTRQFRQSTGVAPAAFRRSREA